MDTVACIIARTKSTRLPGKAVKEIHGKPLVGYIIEKLKYVSNLDEIYMCTSNMKGDELLLEIAKQYGIKSFAGHPESPITRMLEVAEIEGAKNVVRVTGDNVFTDEIYLEKMIKEHKKRDAEYTRTEYLSLGVTSEVIRVDALKKCLGNINPNKSEYLMLFIFDPENYECQVLIPEEKNNGEYTSLTVDTHEDFNRTEFILKKLYRNGRIFYDDIIALDKKNPIPNFKIEMKMPIRLPDNKTIPYHVFRSIMKERIEKSRKITLEDKFYETAKNI